MRHLGGGETCNFDPPTGMPQFIAEFTTLTIAPGSRPPITISIAENDSREICGFTLECCRNFRFFQRHGGALKLRSSSPANARFFDCEPIPHRPITTWFSLFS
jgi:hypothetical protein